MTTAEITTAAAAAQQPIAGTAFNVDEIEEGYVYYIDRQYIHQVPVQDYRGMLQEIAKGTDQAKLVTVIGRLGVPGVYRCLRTLELMCALPIPPAPAQFIMLGMMKWEDNFWLMVTVLDDVLPLAMEQAAECELELNDLPHLQADGPTGPQFPLGSDTELYGLYCRPEKIPTNEAAYLAIAQAEAEIIDKLEAEHRVADEDADDANDANDAK